MPKPGLQFDPKKLAGAISFARQAWRNDGAEGETVHLLADYAEALAETANQTTCAWCGFTSPKTEPGLMLEHLIGCEKRTEAIGRTLALAVERGDALAAVMNELIDSVIARRDPVDIMIKAAQMLGRIPADDRAEALQVPRPVHPYEHGEGGDRRTELCRHHPAKTCELCQ